MNGWRIGVPVAAIVIGVSIARTAMAGGFALFADLPRPDHDARLQGSVLVYQAIGCHASNLQSLTATLEGIVGGNRVTMPLEKAATIIRVPHNIPGMEYYGISRPNVPQGRWVLVLSAVSRTLVTEFKNGKPTDRKAPLTLTRVIPLQPDGTPVTQATPGAKYANAVKSYSIAAGDREKVVTQLLNKPATPAAVAATTPR
jgi:hypothetical protein